MLELLTFKSYPYRVVILTLTNLTGNISLFCYHLFEDPPHLIISMFRLNPPLFLSGSHFSSSFVCHIFSINNNYTILYPPWSIVALFYPLVRRKVFLKILTVLPLPSYHFPACLACK